MFAFVALATDSASAHTDRSQATSMKDLLYTCQRLQLEYARGFGRRPTGDPDFARLPANLDTLRAVHALTPEQEHVRAMFHPWAHVQAFVAGFFQRLFPS